MSFLRKRRGVSGIISGIFLVAVAVMVFNVLAWQFFQYDAYHQIALERDQREWERFNERLAILEIVAGTQYLNFTVRNYGSISAHIVTLYFEFINGTHSVHSLDMWIGPGTTKRMADVGPKLTMTDKYDFMIATERGNTYRPSGQQYTSNEIRPGQGQAVPFIFGFGYSDFQYKQGGIWYPAWKMPTNEVDAVKIFLNNTYPKEVFINPTKTGGVYLTRMRFVPEDFSSSSIRYAAYDQTKTTSIAANSGDWVYFKNVDISTKDRWYVFIEIYYYFYDSPSEIYGTSVVVLAVYT